MREYAVVFEKSNTGWCAFCPDLPGLASCGDTFEETVQLNLEGLEFHLGGMLEDGDAIPDPAARVEMVEIDVPDAPIQMDSRVQSSRATIAELTKILCRQGWHLQAESPSTRTFVKGQKVITLGGGENTMLDEDATWNAFERGLPR